VVCPAMRQGGGRPGELVAPDRKDHWPTGERNGHGNLLLARGLAGWDSFRQWAKPWQKKSEA
jgi:hypothetical protein